jgi:hypothetical protein
LEYNRRVHENNQIDTFKDLIDNGYQDVCTEMKEVAKDLGGVTLYEMYEMGTYKAIRNRRAHKRKSLSQNVARMRLDVASVEMSSFCKSGLEKCIRVINRRF